MIYGSIYIIKNKINDKVYIGQTIQAVDERFKQHCKPSEHKRHKYTLYRAMTKYGVENFYYEIIEENIPVEKLNAKEIYYIDKYNSYVKNNGYNSTKGGDGRLINKIQDIEYVIIEIRKGRFISDIAKEIGVHPYTIIRCLHRNGIKNSRELKPEYVERPDLQIVSRDKVDKLFQNGYSIEEISEELKVHMRTIVRILRKLGYSSKRYNYSSPEVDLVISDYNSGIKRKDILSKYKLSPYVYGKIIKFAKKETQTTIPQGSKADIDTA